MSGSRKRKLEEPDAAEQQPIEKKTEESLELEKLAEMEQRLPKAIIQNVTGEMLSQETLSSQCEMATSGGKTCATEIMVQIGGKTRKLNCQSYCFDHWQQWITSLFFKRPTAIVWNDPVTNRKYNCELEKTRIEFLSSWSFDAVTFEWNKQQQHEWTIASDLLDDPISLAEKQKVRPYTEHHEKFTPTMLKWFQQWLKEEGEQKKSIGMLYEMHVNVVGYSEAPEFAAMTNAQRVKAREGSKTGDVEVLLGKKKLLPFTNREQTDWYWNLYLPEDNQEILTGRLRIEKSLKFKYAISDTDNASNTATASIHGGNVQQNTKTSKTWQTGKRGGRFYIDKTSGRKIYKRK